MAPTCRIVSTRAKRSMISVAYRGGVTDMSVAEVEPSQIRKKANRDAVKTKWRFVPCARTDHRRCRERPDSAVRVRRRTAAPRARGQDTVPRQPRDPVRRAGPRSGRRHAGRRVSPAELAEGRLIQA